MLSELLKDIATKANVQEDKENAVIDPPCGIEFFVSFENGRCPFSGLESCDECICTEQDKLWIDVLKDENLPKC